MPGRIVEVLRRRPGSGAARLVPYFMVDRKRLSRFPHLIRAARDAGADAVELGFPFTDPIADGPTLQAASVRALADGTRWTDLLRAVELTSDELPCAVMTYANPVYRHGLEAATSSLSRAGASGLVVPDLSLEESAPWRLAARAATLSLILMAAPGATSDRTRSLVRASEGFLYLVSRYGVTGGTGFRATPELRAIIDVAHETRPVLPVLVGFGVRSADDARKVLRAGADGLVVGSALEDRLGSDARPARVRAFLSPIARALDSTG